MNRPIAKEMNMTIHATDSDLCMELSWEPMEGKYYVVYDGGGPTCYTEFDSLDEAMAEAEKTWGDCFVDVHDSSGKRFTTGKWDAPMHIIMLRMRDGELNPRQEHILNKWKELPELDFVRKHLSKLAVDPASVLEMMTEKLGTDAVGLFTESLHWGLFEVIRWTNGTSFPEKVNVDRSIEHGEAKAI